MITALVVCFILAPGHSRAGILQARQVIRTDGPESHLQKRGPHHGWRDNPCVSSSRPCSGRPHQSVHLITLSLRSFGLIGFVDDYKKVVEKNTKGLSARRCSGLILLAGSVACFSSSPASAKTYSLFKNFTDL
jgi:phospho-N-acetylmuramoyl-pentapeptide-transferase